MPMTVIKATCETCGEVELTPGDVILNVFEDDAQEAFYEFLCEGCEEVTRKPADIHVQMLLKGGGVEVVIHDSIPEMSEIISIKGPPLGYDDLLDLLMELEKM